MKIYDGKNILIGLVVFIVLATFPVWFNHGKAAPAPEPKLDTPVISQMVNKQCVLPKEEMITRHMKLLERVEDRGSPGQHANVCGKRRQDL